MKDKRGGKTFRGGGCILKGFLRKNRENPYWFVETAIFDVNKKQKKSTTMRGSSPTRKKETNAFARKLKGSKV